MSRKRRYQRKPYKPANFYGTAEAAPNGGSSRLEQPGIIRDLFDSAAVLACPGINFDLITNFTKQRDRQFKTSDDSS